MPAFTNLMQMEGQEYFPKRGIPFGDILEDIFFSPKPKLKIDEFPIHGPKVIRFIDELIKHNLDQGSGLQDCSTTESLEIFKDKYTDIVSAIGGSDLGKTADLLKVAALYHDIGKWIRRENHPHIGANILRSFREDDRRNLVNLLGKASARASMVTTANRYSLIASVVRHHDKFGVVNTGEGALPFFSDILYFRSEIENIDAIKKNVTAVMLLNLADMAAVSIADGDKKQAVLKLGAKVHRLRRSNGSKNNKRKESELLNKISNMINEDDMCLGLPSVQTKRILDDWETVIGAVDDSNVRGDRVQLKNRLIELERSPSRAILRIQRLLEVSIKRSKADALCDYVSPTVVEAALVGTLGAHQFQTFCSRFAMVAKLDYGLNFFRAIACTYIRKEMGRGSKNQGIDSADIKFVPLSKKEADEIKQASSKKKAEIVDKIVILFVRILEGLISRYAGVLEADYLNPRRFGFQMRDLTNPDHATITRTILNFLCIRPHKFPVALNWISDEVTIWSFD